MMSERWAVKHGPVSRCHARLQGMDDMTPGRALELLHVQPPSLLGCTGLREANDRIQRWKASTLRTAYLAQVKLHHPDYGCHAEYDQRTKHTAQLTNAYGVAQSIEIQIKPRHSPVVTRPMRSGRHAWGGSPNTTTTASSSSRAGTTWGTRGGWTSR